VRPIALSSAVSSLELVPPTISLDDVDFVLSPPMLNKVKTVCETHSAFVV